MAKQHDKQFKLMRSGTILITRSWVFVGVPRISV